MHCNWYVLGTERKKVASNYAMCADRKYVKQRLLFFFSQDLVWGEPQPLRERGRSTLRLGGWKEGHQIAVSEESLLLFQYKLRSKIEFLQTEIAIIV
jgi:hypothetical protein